MKLTVQQVYEATLVVAQIIREQRPMPQKGKYRLARMHTKLLPEFTPASERRDAMIAAYETRVTVEGPDGVRVPTDNFYVPTDKVDEFNAAWREIADQEIEVDVEPIPLDQLDLGNDLDGSVQASELIALGDLVSD